MKTLQLKNLKIHLATEPKNELSFLRYYFFLQHFGMITYNVNNVDFRNVLKDYDNTPILDEKRLLLVNYLQSIEINKQKKDAYIECFKAISFLQNEENIVDELLWEAKMETLEMNGLTYLEIETEVNFFYKSLINSFEKDKNSSQAAKNILKDTGFLIE